MAEEVIGLRIQLNGINTVIQDVETFEKVLKEAREDLATIGLQFGVGSKEYKQLAVELQKAEKQFNQITKGNKAARAELEDYRRGTEALSKAFAGATAALTLFGDENETVSSAQKLASQGLTVVIAAQTIAQQELAGATIATTIATKAETLATNTSNKALKALYTTIASNPIGALIAVIGLAVGAFYAFSSSADDAKKSQEEFNKAVNEDAGKSIATFRSLTAVIDDQSLSLETRKKAIGDLRKQYPGYADDLTDEQILVGGLKVRYNELETAIINAARAKAAQTKIETLATEELEITEKLTKATNDRIAAEKALKEAQNAPVTGGGSVAGLGGQIINLTAYEKRLKDATDAEKDLTKQRNDNLQQQQKYGVIIRENTQDTEEYNKRARELAEAEENAAKSTKLNEEAQKRLADAYKKRAEEQLKSLELLIKAGEIEGNVDAEILEKAKKSLEAAQKLRDERNDFFKTDQQEFSELVSRLFFDVIPTEEELKNLSDAYIILFNVLNNRLKDGSTKLLENGKKTTFDIQKLVKDAITELNDPKLYEGLTLEEVIKKRIDVETLKTTIDNLKPEQVDLLKQYFAFFSENAERFSRKIDLKIGEKFIIQPATEDEIQQKLVTFLKRYEDIIDNANLTQPGKQAEIQKLIGELFTLPEKQQKDFITTLDETGEVGFNAYKEAIQLVRDELVVFAKETTQVTKDSDEVASAVGKIVQELLKLRTEFKDLSILDIATTSKEAIKNTNEFRFTLEQIGEAIDFFVEKVGKSPEALDLLFTDIEKNYNKYLARFGEEGLNQLTKRLTEEYGNIEGLNRKQLEQLLTYVELWTERAKTTIGEEAAQPFIDLSNKIKTALNELPTQAEEDFDKTLDKIEKGIRELQNILGNLGTLFSDQFTFELEKIETSYQNALDGIVGDTKEANDKRIELEKGYQKEKKQIEKQARLTSLRIQLAETIAAGAQGVVTALAIPPPAGQILAGINAAIAAAQIALVAQQISFVSSLRRGGRLSAGGLVMGPAHEYGGVRYMNGGVELEGNEAVVNRNSTIKYGSLLSSINQAEGGRPILVGNAMDSRLIEVLAKQKQEPIRAYVLESDITKSQTINRKLEQLASF